MENSWNEKKSDKVTIVFEYENEMKTFIINSEYINKLDHMIGDGGIYFA